MTSKAKSGKSLRARLSNDFLLFDLFTLAFVLITLAETGLIGAAGEAGKYVAVSVMLVIAAILIFKQRTDEFSAECWHFSTSVAFALVLLGPFFLGMLEGFTDGPDNNQRSPFAGESGSSILWGLQIGLFILAFQFKRIRGSMG